MDGNSPKLDKGNAPIRPIHHQRVASNATPQQRLAALMRGVGAEQQPATRTTFNHGALEYRPAPVPPGGNSVGLSTSRPPTGPYTPPYPATGAMSSIPRTFAPTSAAHAPPSQLFPASGQYSGQGFAGNAGMYAYGIPGIAQGYAGGGAMMGQGGNGMVNFGPPPGLTQAAQGAAKQNFDPLQGPAQPSQGTVFQRGVIRGGRPQSFQNQSFQSGPVQKLSYECQARKFNPEFIVNVQDGVYTCDILLKNRLIQSSKRCDDAQDAKIHTAAKALKEIKSWPLPGPLSFSLADKIEQPLSDTTNQPVRDQQGSQSIKEEEEESRRSVQSMGPPEPSTASGVDMTDPIQARAFVEGYRMGQATRFRGSSTEVNVDDIKQIVKQQPKSSGRGRSGRSTRSRSPRRSRRDNRGRRSRSPPRYFDGSRHDPKLPSTDKYRPTPTLSYRNADKPKEEDSYGRLKEEDYAV